jgi:hypothetical protein
MITHKHEHPSFKEPRRRTTARLKQLNKSNRILRRHYASIRHHRVLPLPQDAAA